VAVIWRSIAAAISTSWTDTSEPPWRDMYANPYLFHMGSIFKFGPEGGRVYGNYSTRDIEDDVDVVLDKAPADAVAYKSGYLG